jgi:hypothetical protein
MFSVRNTIIISAGALIILMLAVFLPTASTGVRQGAFENIRSIPFPVTHRGILITEKLAHVDLLIPGLVVAKKLDLTLTLSPPINAPTFIGVRENSFWLSYTWIPLTLPNETEQTLTREISIPLTDKIQDQDGSVDLMILTGTPAQVLPPETGPQEKITWTLQEFSAVITPTWPSPSEWRNFVTSLVYRERPE